MTNHAPDIQSFDWELSTDKEHCLSYELSSLASTSPELDALAQKIFSICDLGTMTALTSPAAVKTAHARLILNLKSLLWHLYLATQTDHDLYVRIPRTSAFFNKAKPENVFGITREVCQIMDRLEVRGLIESAKGFFDHKKQAGKQTRIRATQALRQHLSKLPPNMKEAPFDGPAAIVKDRETKAIRDPVAFETVPSFISNQATVKDFNDLTQAHDIKLAGLETSYALLPDRHGKLQVYNITRTKMHAVFLVGPDGTLTYGRKHGGFWQNIPSALRRLITIDGQKTIELDYSAQVLNILASQAGRQLQGDPYEVRLPALFTEIGNPRKLVKQAVIIAVNAASQRKAFAALRRVKKDAKGAFAAIRFSDKALSDLFSAIFAAHPYLEEQAFQGRGLDVFAQDAEIARLIMQRFVDQRQVVLPIHDGFITTEENAQLLYDTMREVWFETFGTTIGIKAETPDLQIDINTPERRLQCLASETTSPNETFSKAISERPLCSNMRPMRKPMAQNLPKRISPYSTSSMLPRGQHRHRHLNAFRRPLWRSQKAISTSATRSVHWSQWSRLSPSALRGLEESNNADFRL